MRVLIIGAGAIGLSTAYFLSREGVEVTVADPRGPGGGASRRNAGWVVPTMSGPVPAPGVVAKALRWSFTKDSPVHIRPSVDPAFARFMLTMLRRCNPRDFDRGMRATARLNEATFTLFDLLESEGVRFEQHRDGLLMAFRSEHALAEHAAEAARLAELGLGEHAVVSGRQVRELEPALTSSVVGGIRWPGERFVDPDTFVDGLAAACRANGVQIRCDRAELGADRLARIDGERVAADAIVVCAGVWTPNVLAGAGIRLPVQAGKGYGVDHRPGPLPLSRALYLPEEKVAVTPLNAGIRAAGVMEFTGVDESLDRRRAEGVSAAVGRYLRGWPDRAGAATWAGLRPMTPDGLPVIGPLPGGDALHVATGHAMLGITLAPVTGRLLADTITRGAVPTEALPFLPARFLR